MCARFHATTLQFFFLCRFLTFVVPLRTYLQNLSRRLLFVRSVAIKTHGEMTGFLKRLLLPEVLLLRVQNVLLFLAHPNAIFGESFVRSTERLHAFKHSLKISMEQNGLFSTHLLGIVMKRTPHSFFNIFAIRNNISPRSSGCATQFKTIELRMQSNSSSRTLRAKKSLFSIFGCCEFKSIERNRIQLGD